MKELDKITVINFIVDLKIKKEQAEKAVEEYSELKTWSERFYNESKVYEYLIDCLNEKLK